MIRNLFSRNNNANNHAKIPKKDGFIQVNAGSSHGAATPPIKNSNKLGVDKNTVVKKHLQILDTRAQTIKTRVQPNINTNKENDLPNRNTKSQKLPIIAKPPLPEETIDEPGNKEDVPLEALKAKEEINYYEKVVEHIDIEIGPSLNLDLLYEIDYGKSIESYLFSHQPDYSNCLRTTEVRKDLRTKMVDWMIEVLANYYQTTSHHTFFLAVTIMDLYFKNSKKKIRDPDVHLIGITSMFIASKYDDVYYITLVDFVERVCHKKFSADDIKAKEWDILCSLDYNVNIPTVLDYLERLIYKNFHEDGYNMLKSIKEAAIYILKMCLHEYHMMNFQPLTLALAVLLYCIKCYFYSLSEENSKNGNTIDLAEQEKTLILSILKSAGHVKVQDVEDCIHRINELTHNFEKKYSEMRNLRKFSEVYSR